MYGECWQCSTSGPWLVQWMKLILYVVVLWVGVPLLWSWTIADFVLCCQQSPCTMWANLGILGDSGEPKSMIINLATSLVYTLMGRHWGDEASSSCCTSSSSNLASFCVESPARKMVPHRMLFYSFHYGNVCALIARWNRVSPEWTVWQLTLHEQRPQTWVVIGCPSFCELLLYC